VIQARKQYVILEREVKERAVSKPVALKHFLVFSPKIEKSIRGKKVDRTGRSITGFGGGRGGQRLRRICNIRGRTGREEKKKIKKRALII
jgi:hypothetical protein